MTWYDNGKIKESDRRQERTRRFPWEEDKIREDKRCGRHDMQDIRKGERRGKEKGGWLDYRTSWKSIFHRIERFALPRIFLGSPKESPHLRMILQDLPAFEIPASSYDYVEGKKKSFPAPDKLRRKRRHMSPAIFLHIRRDMFFPQCPRIFRSSHLPPRLLNVYGFISFLLLFITSLVNFNSLSFTLKPKPLGDGIFLS